MQPSLDWRVVGIPASFTDEDSPHVHVFGGGNNDGGAFAGVELASLANDYSVESVTVE